MKQLTPYLIFLVAGYLALCTAACALQRKLLYYPSHHAGSNGLAAWTIDGRLVGYARLVDHPENVWLFTHGNGGQAADRVYALSAFSPRDAVYILEYPGYGQRPGSPSKKTLDAAAAEAYRWLRREFPGTSVCAAGESIGSGPACSLALLAPAPDQITLVVPFDNLASVAREHFPLLPVWLLLSDRWDNVAALKGYRGRVEVFAAAQDEVIPVRHAKALADQVPGALFHEIPGGHNDWSLTGMVRFIHTH